MVKTISVSEAMQRKDAIFIDTRTPAEYEEDCLPNAINLPLFSNEERAIIGTIYKQVSPEKAVEQGIEFFSQKLPSFVKEINQYRKKQIIIYCWRGGMRSRTVTALLESLKYNVLQLEGGHKAYRAYVRETLNNFQLKPKLIVLWGVTCTGKTSLIQKLTPSIDLEGLAQHRGSMYGSLGLKPHSQKKFENLLLQQLESLNDKPYIFVEGESPKIGDVQIPPFFYKAMKKGLPLLITRSIDLRAQEAIAQYHLQDLDMIQVKAITCNLPHIISNKRKQEICELLDQKQYQHAIKILLEEYYDPLYKHTLEQFQFQAEINSDDEEKAITEILTFCQEKIPPPLNKNDP